MSNPHAIGEDSFLRFIDEMNDIRARSGNRFRYRPMRKDNGVLGMHEHYAIARPTPATVPSPRFYATTTAPYGYKD